MKPLKKNLGKIRRGLAGHGVSITKNDRKLSSLENKYLGERAVIIGNGPSLKTEDLERLDGFFSFASNKIFLAFSNTDWRPEFYTISDVQIAQNCSKFHYGSDFSNTVVINASATRNILTSDLPFLYFSYSGSFNIENWGKGEAVTAPKNFGNGIYPGGYSVMIDQLQMAFLMGFSEVALIGADLSYFEGEKTGERCKSGELVEYDEQKSRLNYFHKDYCLKGEKNTVPMVAEMKHAWDYSYALFEQSGRRLVNASRRTALTSVPRVEFDDYFPS